MGEKITYFIAVVAAGAVFAASGGIQASEKAVQTELGQARATAPRAVPDASIPFPNSGGIRDWHPDGTQGLYVQDAQGRWYHATLMGPCFDLPYTESIAFLTRGADSLDKFSAVAVRGRRCQFSSFVASAPPPAKARRHKDKSHG
jgi:hypothetical protein